MNKFRTLTLILLASFGLVLTACGSKSPDDSKVLATINGDVITQNDYDDYLNARQMQQPPIDDKEKEKQTVMDEMINRVLLVQNARQGTGCLFPDQTPDRKYPGARHAAQLSEGQSDH